VNQTVIGLLHPGEMGAAIGRCLTGRGHTVLWASEGRGPASARRAEAAGLTDAGTAQAVAGRAEVILSVCPPHAAMDVARAVAGFGGLYVDPNAVSPGTAQEIGTLIAAGGGRYVDGGIIGPPPVTPGQTRLYLSGPRAQTVSELFAGSPLEARVIGESPTAASAVKMAYAGWTKGSAALLLAVRALAQAEGVEDTLHAEWALSQPSLPGRSLGSARSATAKGWRWIAEMEEISASMTAAGLPSGFHEAAAEIFRRTPRARTESVAVEPASASAPSAEPGPQEPANTAPASVEPRHQEPASTAPPSAEPGPQEPADAARPSTAAGGTAAGAAATATDDGPGIDAVLAALRRR
jgi:3-hydroxyisobutyrate dehydrogenase-like beta-hydroxyacid dehydrogenase